MKRFAISCMRLNAVVVSLFALLLSVPAYAQESGWYFTGYTFKDGTMQKESLLAGTSAKLKDVISYKGAKGSITITHNRLDGTSGKLLHGVSYMVSWTDPAGLLQAGTKYSVNYALKTISSQTWKAPQQTVYFNQGPGGVYFVSPQGTKYISTDLSAQLKMEKEVVKGSKGQTREIQVNMGNGFAAIYRYEWREGLKPVGPAPVIAESGRKPGWYFTGYLLKDGTLQKESLLAGTSAKLKDVISYKGGRGSMTITHNRLDGASGKLLHGVSYQVNWTDPADLLEPGTHYTVNYTLKTISSRTWKAPQQSVYFNQGLSGVYFVTPQAAKYINSDMSAELKMDKEVAKGSKGQQREIQVNLGNGFVALYRYEWKD